MISSDTSNLRAKKKFWIVLIEGTFFPRSGFFVHLSLEEATEEACRLIRKERRPAVILEAILYGELETSEPPIKWHGL